MATAIKDRLEILDFNNLIGGRGLNTDLLDTAHISIVLRQILLDGKPYSVLQDYAAQCREVILSRTNRSSTLQKKRLMSAELEDIQEREELFGLLKGLDHLEFERKLAEGQMAMITSPW
ncbi:hypothetical protein BDD12DRAFT_895034 [Trichophaea hybrida]|nr:hypothetical protein BDD12DRAFT_895034 [Trichophaea hybrida]